MKQPIMMFCTYLAWFLVACDGDFNDPQGDEANTYDDSEASVEPSEPSEAKPLAFDSATAMFKNVKSRRCIGVDGASMANGALLKQFKCVKGAPNQSWRFELTDFSGIYNLKNAKSGKCIGVDGASTSPNANIGQYDCAPMAPNQQWNTGAGLVSPLVNIKSGLCIAPAGKSTANAVQLKQVRCTGAKIQDWRNIFL